MVDRVGAVVGAVQAVEMVCKVGAVVVMGAVQAVEMADKVGAVEMVDEVGAVAVLGSWALFLCDGMYTYCNSFGPDCWARIGPNTIIVDHDVELG